MIAYLFDDVLHVYDLDGDSDDYVAEHTTDRDLVMITKSRQGCGAAEFIDDYLCGGTSGDTERQLLIDRVGVMVSMTDAEINGCAGRVQEDAHDWEGWKDAQLDDYADYVRYMIDLIDRGFAVAATND